MHRCPHCNITLDDIDSHQPGPTSCETCNGLILVSPDDQLQPTHDDPQPLWENLLRAYEHRSPHNTEPLANALEEFAAYDGPPPDTLGGSYGHELDRAVFDAVARTAGAYLTSFEPLSDECQDRRGDYLSRLMSVDCIHSDTDPPWLEDDIPSPVDPSFYEQRRQQPNHLWTAERAFLTADGTLVWERDEHHFARKLSRADLTAVKSLP